MTKLLDQAIEKVRQLPRERQDEAAELLLSMLDDSPETLQLSAQQVAEVERRLREPAGYVPHAEVLEFFQKKAE